MKKLMIAAAIALVGGACAADDLCNEIIGGGAGCSVYDVKFQFKTLGAKDAKCSAAQLAAAACLAIVDTDGDGVVDAGLAYLDNQTRKFNGLLWQCESACFEGVEPNAQTPGAGAINYVLWETKSQKAISPKAIYDSAAVAAQTPPYWKGGTGNTDASNEQNQFDILGRYGSKAQKVTAFWTPSLNNDEITAYANAKIYAAGFGTYDTKNKRMKTVSGNAVAKLAPLAISNATTCGETGLVPVLAYMCQTFKSWCCCECVSAAGAPASGTWSVKFNASKAKSGKLSNLIPEYAYEVQ